MTITIPSNFLATAKISGLVALVFLLAACAQKPAPSGINDPDEANNRKMHAFNLALDETILKPLSSGYGGVPGPLKDGLTNFADNLDVPGDVVNNLVQGRPDYALENTLRFAVNTILGIGGLFDPASELGIMGKETDFGETLHVYGFGEGAYVELPLLGPSTERDVVGSIVDVGLNPVRLLLPSPESYVGTVAGLASRLGDRSQYSDTLDSILYQSADSYAQLRLLYLQNRRFELGQTIGDDSFLDPYEDPYGQ